MPGFRSFDELKSVSQRLSLSITPKDDIKGFDVSKRCLELLSHAISASQNKNIEDPYDKIAVLFSSGAREAVLRRIS